MKQKQEKWRQKFSFNKKKNNIHKNKQIQQIKQKDSKNNTGTNYYIKKLIGIQKCI